MNYNKYPYNLTPSSYILSRQTRKIKGSVDSLQMSYRHPSPISMARFLQKFILLVCIAIFPAQISSETLTSVTLHTSIYFRDYIDSTSKTNTNNDPSTSSTLTVTPPKGWPILKAIESIRFYGGNMAGMKSIIRSSIYIHRYIWFIPIAPSSWLILIYNLSSYVFCLFVIPSFLPSFLPSWFLIAYFIL